MGWQHWIEDYFRFSRRDRLAVLCLLLFILVFFIAPVFLRGPNPGPLTREDSAWIAALRKMETGEGAHDDENWVNQQKKQPNNRMAGSSTNVYRSGTYELFYFDPNHLTRTEWEKLGLRDKTITILLNYISKGGRFREPEDLSRIYGLQEKEYTRLKPYIRIEKKLENQSFRKENIIRPINPPVRNRYEEVDINRADTAAFIALPGIGSKLASRIVSFRDKLGGFYEVEQVAETFGLPDSTFLQIRKYLKLDKPVIRRININTANLEELKSHPYIRYKIANLIIAYRNEHGPFPAVEGLKKVMAVTDEVFNKIAPYLTTVNE